MCIYKNVLFFAIRSNNKTIKLPQYSAYNIMWDTLVINSTQFICQFIKGSKLLYIVHTQMHNIYHLKNPVPQTGEKKSSFKCNYWGGHTWVHMLAKYLLNKYDKLATTHLLWTPWGFYRNVTKSSDSKGLREFHSLSACLDSCHFQWPSLAPTACTITLRVCYFFHLILLRSAEQRLEKQQRHFRFVETRRRLSGSRI